MVKTLAEPHVHVLRNADFHVRRSESKVTPLTVTLWQKMSLLTFLFSRHEARCVDTSFHGQYREMALPNFVLPSSCYEEISFLVLRTAQA